MQPMTAAQKWNNTVVVVFTTVVILLIFPSAMIKCLLQKSLWYQRFQLIRKSMS